MTVDVQDISGGDFAYEAAPSQPTYSYYLTDLRNNDIVGELDLVGVTYSSNLSGIGEFSGSISINRDTLSFQVEQGGDSGPNVEADRTYPTFNIREVTTPGRFGLYIMRNGVPVWGGFIWTRRYDSGDNGGTLTLSGKTFESYFYHRFQRQTMYWAETDQLDIARWLVTSNGSAAALSIEVDTATSPRYRERTMFGYEFKTTGEELEQLANLIDGFDWNVIVGLDSDQKPTRKLTFYYPEAGVRRDKTTLQFEYPGVIKNFTMTDDAESGGNYIWAIGAGEGSEMLFESASDYGQLSAGWPVLEASRSHKSVLKPSTLRDHANKALSKLNTPTSVFTVEIRGDLDPVFGTYNLGDWAKFRFRDYYFWEWNDTMIPDGQSSWGDPQYRKSYYEPVYERMARITGISVSIDDASGVESISLTLGGDELAGEDA